jgi:chemotaxis protein MotB
LPFNLEEEYVNTRFRFSSIPVRSLIALAAIAALTAGCGVSKSKYSAMTKERDDAMAKNAQLQTNLDDANKNVATLQSDKATLESDKATLDSKVKEMEATTAEQQKTLDDAKAQYESMIGQMKTELSSGKIEVEQMRDGINVSLAQDILFKSGSADLGKEGKEILLKVAENLKTSPYQVIVNGHTDNQKIGGALAKKYPSNWELGGARAAVIVRLFEGAGVSKERLSAVSYSDSRPREGNETPQGREKNRRIEIRLRPVANAQTAGSSN